MILPYTYSKSYTEDVSNRWTAPWDKNKDKIIWQKNFLVLYTGNSVLEASTRYITKNRMKDAQRILNLSLQEKNLSADIKGKLHNNLAISYLLKKPIELEKSKFHIDQAGLLLHSHKLIMNNIRVITLFFQKDVLGRSN